MQMSPASTHSLTDPLVDGHTAISNCVFKTVFGLLQLKQKILSNAVDLWIYTWFIAY